MPRERSIPGNLRNSVFTRYLNGHSTLRIAGWLNAKHPPEPGSALTSRSSVERLVEHCSMREGIPSSLPIVRRCRREAADNLDTLDEVQQELRRCFFDADSVTDAPRSAARINTKLKTLALLERSAARRVKLAGVNFRKLDKMEEEVDYEDVLEDYDGQLCEELGKELDEPAVEESGQPVAQPESNEKSVRIEGHNCEKTSVNESDVAIASQAPPDAENLTPFAPRTAPSRNGKGQEIRTLPVPGRVVSGASRVRFPQDEDEDEDDDEDETPSTIPALPARKLTWPEKEARFAATLAALRAKAKDLEAQQGNGKHGLTGGTAERPPSPGG